LGRSLGLLLRSQVSLVVAGAQVLGEEEEEEEEERESR